MIKPETSDFLGNELDKAKLEIASYWKDKYEKTQKALDIAIDALTYINTNMVIAENVYFPETDKIVVAQKALKQIKTALEQKEE